MKNRLKQTFLKRRNKNGHRCKKTLKITSHHRNEGQSNNNISFTKVRREVRRATAKKNRDKYYQEEWDRNY
jgi:hypothetical protein